MLTSISVGATHDLTWRAFIVVVAGRNVAIASIVTTVAVIVNTSTSIFLVIVSGTLFARRTAVAAPRRTDLRTIVVAANGGIGIVKTFLVFGNRPVAKQGSSF